MVAATLAAGCGPKGPRVTEESSKYTDEGHTIGFTPAGTYSFSLDDYGKYTIYPAYYVSQWIGIKGSTFQFVQEVSLRNLKITKAPKLGTITAELDTSGSRASGADYVTWTGGSFYELGAIRISFTSSKLGEHVLGKDFSGAHSTEMAFWAVANSAGLKSDDLRFRVSYRLEIVDLNNKRFFLDKEIDVIPGDFLKANQEYRNEKVEPFKQQ